MTFLLVVFMIDVEYSLSVFLCVWLFMIVILSSSSSSSAVATSTNLLLVLCWVGYNELAVFGSRFCLFILTDLDPGAPNCHPIHCFCCCCCFQVSCCSINQFAFWCCCARTHPFPSTEPSKRVFVALLFMCRLWYVPPLG